MGSVPIRVLLFISSYFPLSVIFAVQLWKDHYYTACVVLGVGLTSLLVLPAYMRRVRRLAPVDLIVKSIARKDAESISYIVTYVIPFMAVQWGDPRNIISLCIFFLILGFLYVQSNMIQINPMLVLFGLHLYEVENEDGMFFWLITGRRIQCGEKLEAVKIGDDLLVAMN